MFPTAHVLLFAALLAPPAPLAPPATSPAAVAVTTATPVAATAATLPSIVAWAPSPATRPEQASLFTLVDYFDQGQRLAKSYLDALAPTARGQFRTADLAPACVRVSCERDGGRSVVYSTGVLVNGGRHVVTAGHGVGELGEAGAALSVILTDGRPLPARLIHRSAMDSTDQDWAVLEVTGTPPSGIVSVPVAAARPGGLAFIMGYPERVGLGADGHATSALTAGPTALDPLLFVARVPLSVSSDLEPLAGALPLSGASGSPVFDENGALVGVLVAIGRLAYPDGLRHVYRVSLSADFRSALGT